MGKKSFSTCSSFCHQRVSPKNGRISRPISYIRHSATRSAVETIIPRFLHAALAKLPHLLHAVLHPLEASSTARIFRQQHSPLALIACTSCSLKKGVTLTTAIEFLVRGAGCCRSVSHAQASPTDFLMFHCPLLHYYFFLCCSSSLKSTIFASCPLFYASPCPTTIPGISRSRFSPTDRKWGSGVRLFGLVTTQTEVVGQN